jgi:hypothetical protein
VNIIAQCRGFACVGIPDHNQLIDPTIFPNTIRADACGIPVLNEEAFTNGTSPNKESVPGFVDQLCNLEEDSAKDEVIFFDTVIEQISVRFFLPKKPDQ